MKPVPLFGDSIQALSPFISAQRRLNCIYEVRTDGDKNNIVIIPTPGLSLFLTLPSAPIRGWIVVRSILYVVAGNIFFSVNSGGGVSNLGTITTSSTGYVALSDNGIQVIILDGIKGWFYNIQAVSNEANAGQRGAGYFGQISDANFPNNATSVCYLHGRFSVNLPNTQQFYTGGSYTAGTWTPVIFNTKTDHSDLLSQLSVLHDTMILWGFTSIEFFQDTGAYPNPYSRIPGVTQDWGLAAPYAKCVFSNTIAFLGQNTQGQVQIMTLNGYIPQRISTHDIEEIINEASEYGTIASAVMYSYMFNGHILLQLTIPSSNRSFLYDDTTKIWSEVQTGVGLFQRHLGNLCITFASGNYVADSTTGNIYYYDEEVYTDNGVTIPRQVRSRHINGGGNYVQVGMLQLDMETGVGIPYGQGSNPQIMLQVSRDGGRTFEGERWASLGAQGQYLTRVVWRRIGEAMDFVFQFTMTDPVGFTIAQAWADPAEDMSEV